MVLGRVLYNLHGMMPYERLKAWHHCHRFVLAAYSATRGFPGDERFGLTAQIRRAAVSAASNIAEGSAKRGAREFRRYLDIAVGSLAEVAYLILLARDLGYLSKDDWMVLETARSESGKTTWGLYARIRRRALEQRR